MKADFKKSKQVLNKKLLSQNKKSADDAKSGEVSAQGLKAKVNKKEFVSRIDQGNEKTVEVKKSDIKPAAVDNCASGETKKAILKRK